MNVIKAIAAFHTQPALVRWAIPPGYRDNFFIFDIKGQLTANAAIRADGLNLTVWRNG